MLAVSVSAFAYSGGPPNNYANNPPNSSNCSTCHSSFGVNSGNGEFLISLGVEEYTPGETYEVSVTLTDPGQSRWGFELTVQDDSNFMAGSFAVTDATNTQLADQGGDSPDFMKQTSAGTYNGDGSATWTFDWTAPESGSGDVTFYASGNAANGDFGTAGDYIYTIALPIPEAASEANPPSMFSLLTPMDEEVYPDTELEFTWEEAIDSDPGDEVSYEIYASTSEDDVMENMVGTSTTNSYQFMGADDMQYWWTVKAVDTNTDGTWANETWSFMTAFPEAPEEFDLDMPADEYMSPSAMVTLSWMETSDPDPGDMITYEVYVSMNEDDVMDNMVGSTDGMTFEFEGENSMMYYWTIKAADTNTEGTWANSTRSFTIDVNGAGDLASGTITDWKLGSAYPNPFNAETRFDLSVPEASRVTVTVYDLLGREVTRLHQGNLSAGLHTFNWHADTPAGVYFLRVQSANGFSALQKMVLLK